MGLKGRIEMMMPENILKKIAPKIVPNMYMDITPRHSGEAMPNFSVIKAKLDSLPIEWVIPIDSRRSPSKIAKGKENTMVPKLPIS